MQLVVIMQEVGEINVVSVARTDLILDATVNPEKSRRSKRTLLCQQINHVIGGARNVNNAPSINFVEDGPGLNNQSSQSLWHIIVIR